MWESDCDILMVVVVRRFRLSLSETYVFIHMKLNSIVITSVPT